MKHRSMSKGLGFSNAVYSMLLFAPFGFWILGIVISMKALRSRDLGLLKKEIKQMFYYSTSQN